MHAISDTCAELAALCADAERDGLEGVELAHYIGQLQEVTVTTERDPDCGDTDVDMTLPEWPSTYPALSLTDLGITDISAFLRGEPPEYWN